MMWIQQNDSNQRVSGVNRMAQKTLGLSNVKEATLFPRDINRLAP